MRKVPLPSQQQPTCSFSPAAGLLKGVFVQNAQNWSFKRKIQKTETWRDRRGSGGRSRILGDPDASGGRRRLRKR